MSSYTFTPSDVVDKSKERDWAASLGMMDWDTTKIVFTKRTFIEFLKYTGTTVDTNFSNISKLPKYAEFGKISSNEGAGASTDEADLATGVSKLDVSDSAAAAKEESAFRPSRRVRTGPGGLSAGLFEEEFPDDALSQAPPKAKAAETEAPATATVKDTTDEPFQPASRVRPSRRVRTAPGGKDHLSEGLFGDNNDPEFKPTHKVRQVPGGQDTHSSLFG